MTFPENRATHPARPAGHCEAGCLPLLLTPLGYLPTRPRAYGARDGEVGSGHDVDRMGNTLLKHKEWERHPTIYQNPSSSTSFLKLSLSHSTIIKNTVNKTHRPNLMVKGTGIQSPALPRSSRLRCEIEVGQTAQLRLFTKPSCPLRDHSYRAQELRPA